MRAEIIQDHDLARTQARYQNLFKIGLEHDCRHTAGDAHAWADTRERQGADRGRVFRSVAWECCPGPLAFGRTRIAWGQVQVGAKLVDDDEISRINLLLEDGKLSTCPGVALAGNQALFLRVSPKRVMARRRVEGLSVTPWLAFHWAVCSASVASGIAAT